MVAIGQLVNITIKGVGPMMRKPMILIILCYNRWKGSITFTFFGECDLNVMSLYFIKHRMGTLDRL